MGNRHRFLMTALLTVTAMIMTATVGGGGRAGAVAGTAAVTVVIDAGHGGEDGGAVSLSGRKESELNLNIAEKLEAILAFYGTPVVMTRTQEHIAYSDKAVTIRQKKVEDQKNRLRLIESTDNAMLISIHQNKYPDGKPFGAQALYAPTAGSKELAEYMQGELIRALNTKNRRTAAKVTDSIMLLNHVTCPAVLVECGFLSNAAEEKLLLTDAYRLKVAAVIAASYLYNRDSLSVIINGGTP